MIGTLAQHAHGEECQQWPSHGTKDSEGGLQDPGPHHLREEGHRHAHTPVHTGQHLADGCGPLGYLTASWQKRLSTTVVLH